MSLKECKQLWGIDISYIISYSKVYRLRSAILYALDVVIMIGLMFIMYKERTSLASWTFVLVMFTLLLTLLFSVMLDVNAWVAYKFYRKYKNEPVKELSVRVDCARLKNILFCVKSHRGTSEKEAVGYISTMYNLCTDDVRYAYKLYKLFDRYADESGKTVVKYVSFGKHNYIVGIDYEEELVNNETTEEIEEVTNPTEE